MKSELQFFMRKENEEEFFDSFNERCEKKIYNSFYFELWIGLNCIQFHPSKIYENQLTSGRIAYITIDLNDNRAENLYKEMRQYIKKNYKNKMRAVSTINLAAVKCYNLYYTNDVASWILENPDKKLVQFKDGLVHFIPELS